MPVKQSLLYSSLWNSADERRAVYAANFAPPLGPPFGVVRLASVVLREVVFFGDTSERVVALTLDDGPHSVLTPRVLDMLARHNAMATFFLIGSRIEGNATIVRRIAAEGHEFGNHTWADKCSAGLSCAELSESVQRTHDVLQGFGPVRLFRPGAGWVTPNILEVARRHRYRCVLGSVYPQDVRVGSTRWIVNDVLSRTRPGAIVILHEGKAGRERVLSILGQILPELSRRGYRVTTVSELLAASDAS